MSSTSFLRTRDDAEAFDPDVVKQGGASFGLSWLPSVSAVEHRRTDSRGIQAEIALVAQMRNQYFGYRAEYAAGASLVWRLMLATALAAAIFAVGATLTIVALFENGARPNPYVAVSVLLVGVALTGTVVKIVRSG